MRTYVGPHEGFVPNLEQFRDFVHGWPILKYLPLSGGAPSDSLLRGLVCPPKRCSPLEPALNARRKKRESFRTSNLIHNALCSWRRAPPKNIEIISFRNSQGQWIVPRSSTTCERFRYTAFRTPRSWVPSAHESAGSKRSAVDVESIAPTQFGSDMRGISALRDSFRAS